MEIHAGSLIHVGETRIIPFAQTVRMKIPGARLVWHRPAAILAQTPDGKEIVLPIQDVTRQAQIVLFSVGILGTLLLWCFYQYTNKGGSNVRKP